MEKIFSDFARITRKRAIKFEKNHFELAAWACQSVVCGIDEVGRGCLAGPLVSAAVIVPINTTYRGLKDSKTLTEEERNKAYSWIIKNCWYGLGMASNTQIDTHNIWHATLISMKRALVNLLAHYPGRPQAILIDAMPLNLYDTSYFDIPIRSFPNGEKKSISIAAASIVAKVRRDAMMKNFDLAIPGYSLGQHKGYGTAAHQDALAIRGRSIIHRESFLKKFVEEKKFSLSEQSQQQLIYETE